MAGPPKVVAGTGREPGTFPSLCHPVRPHRSPRGQGRRLSPVYRSHPDKVSVTGPGHTASQRQSQALRPARPVFAGTPVTALRSGRRHRTAMESVRGSPKASGTSRSSITSSEPGDELSLAAGGAAFTDLRGRRVTFGMPPATEPRRCGDGPPGAEATLEGSPVLGTEVLSLGHSRGLPPWNQRTSSSWLSAGGWGAVNSQRASAALEGPCCHFPLPFLSG